LNLRMKTVAVARHAMATRFEIVLCGGSETALRAAGEAALDEIERLEGQLSLFRETSELAHLNARAAAEPVRVSPPVFELLRRAQSLSRETDGAFDVTVAPLMRCWGFHRGEGRVPDAEDLARARERVGMSLVGLGEVDCTVRFTRPGVMLDLGALGKGYAVDCAVDILREAGVKSALIHGGTSTAYGLGEPPGAEHWTVALPRPEFGPQFLSPGAAPGRDLPGTILTKVNLRDEALSVSAIWGRSFAAGGRTYGHVMDPRVGAPVEGAVMSAVVAPSAADTDALSTALLVLGAAGPEHLAMRWPELRTWVVSPRTPAGEFPVHTRGIPVV
jgi:thiamine biosynthesis lipoprotein